MKTVKVQLTALMTNIPMKIMKRPFIEFVKLKIMIRKVKRSHL
jgi:hypothetical protein